MTDFQTYFCFWKFCLLSSINTCRLTSRIVFASVRCWFVLSHGKFKWYCLCCKWHKLSVVWNLGVNAASRTLWLLLCQFLTFLSSWMHLSSSWFDIREMLQTMLQLKHLLRSCCHAPHLLLSLLFLSMCHVDTHCREFKKTPKEYGKICCCHHRERATNLNFKQSKDPDFYC